MQFLTLSPFHRQMFILRAGLGQPEFILNIRDSMSTSISCIRVEAAVLLAVLLAMATTIVPAQANFHIMNSVRFGVQGLYLIPSNQYNCNGFDSNKKVIGFFQYPECNKNRPLRIPDGLCGWSGVTIRPACGGNYFGKIYGGSGEPQGDCYWNDAGDKVSFTCTEGPVYDRLVCYTSMCGQLISNKSLNVSLPES